MTQPSSTAGLSRSRKAAMVVQLLLRDGDDLPISQLPEEAQARLARELGALSMIDKPTLDSVVAEFSDELSRVALTAPGSVEAALKSLDGRISAKAAARIRDEVALRDGHDPWVTLRALEPQELLPITEAESPEVCAVLLAKLPTERAAALLGLMPGERARRIAYAMSKTTGVKPAALAVIGEGLVQNYCGATTQAFSDSAETRIGAILNSTTATRRDEVLEGLMSEDEEFGTGVRKAIFTFEDILTRLAPLDVPKVLRDVDQVELVRALSAAGAAGGTMAEVSEFLLGNMSTRMADSLREEMGELGKIKPSDAEAAQSAVVAAIRAAADEGVITLVEADEPE